MSKHIYRDGDFGFKPLNDLIIIDPIREAGRQNGLIVVSAETLKPTRGKVLAVGPGRLNEQTGEREEIPVNVGDVVTFLPDSINQVKADGRVLSMIRASTLVGVEVA